MNKNDNIHKSENIKYKRKKQSQAEAYNESSPNNSSQLSMSAAE